MQSILQRTHSGCAHAPAHVYEKCCTFGGGAATPEGGYFTGLAGSLPIHHFMATAARQRTPCQNSAYPLEESRLLEANQAGTWFLDRVCAWGPSRVRLPTAVPNTREDIRPVAPGVVVSRRLLACRCPHGCHSAVTGQWLQRTQGEGVREVGTATQPRLSHVCKKQPREIPVSKLPS